MLNHLSKNLNQKKGNEQTLTYENIVNQEWRLNNLYWIKDADGNRVPFRMNATQLCIFRNKWLLNIFLKARQLGCTTFIDIYLLDCVLFLGKDAAIIAHTMPNAQLIFDSKVKFVWENLPKVIKDVFVLDSDTAQMLKFRHQQTKTESSIYVATSLRGGTLNLLHVSELSTIDQKYPEKSQEIWTGALNTINPGQEIFIESTAKGRYGKFFDLCQIARQLKTEDKTLTSLDYKFFFFPWYLHPHYRIKEEIVIPRRINDYINAIEKQMSVKIDREQRAWYFKKKLTQKEAMMSEFPSTPDEAFLATIEGSYYDKQMNRLREKKQITRVPHTPTLKVDTWWDLGIGDSMSITFTQQSGIEVRIIDYYENSGEGLAHYVKVLNDKGYVYDRFNFPHDIEVQEIGTGKTRKAVALKLGLKPLRVMPKLSIADGIEAVRNILPKCWFDEENCDKLIKALTEYRKEWDDNLGVFKERPLHNWACLTQDTKIRTLRGWKNIKDIANTDYVWGYSLKEHRLVPAKVIWAGKTRKNAELLEITLDNDKKIKCTPDHLFLLRSEEYKRADELKEGDSLMPFYEKTSRHKDYKEIFLNDGSWASEHRFVYSRFNGILKTTGITRSGYVIHHKDGNEKNCNPENLEQLTISEHCKIHIQSPERIKKRDMAWKKALKVSKKIFSHKCLECGADFKAIKTAKYCSKKCKAKYGRRKKGIPERKFKKNHRVKSIRKLTEREDTYDLIVPETHNFVAEEVVVHNSHPADSFRTLAVGLEEIGKFGHYDEEEREMMRMKEKRPMDPFNPFPEL